MQKLKAWLNQILQWVLTKAESKTLEVKTVSNKITLAALTASAIADGTSEASIQATVVDDAGAAVSGVAVSFSTTVGSFRPDPSVTDASGLVTASLVSSTEGEATVTASLADGTIATATVNFTAVPIQAVDDPALTSSVADSSAVADTSTSVAVASSSALADFKAKAEAEIEKFAKFVEHGIEVLGAEAEAELVSLKDKYL